ncbi:N-acetyl-gamma-glutamyl-phosphate reductase [Pullulanibacillus sp. KACC 23026]|uniref:N-acetyl-gamma-glutamyl-phosphate reductase n=1 Tax=Pullulanibacillus sp. KACC 23026 TaxID=3028315 RepID=UPI0023AE9492|nr:N-acetyl-gamma-glutamyl-phosphate reductase [Pullulanibacillus sp. KACC 23026]WEG13063.1 N-acetyl-gamma-glutamyl-phosphate reductase [Pullulanibacillus sp. KACC 23026]
MNTIRVGIVGANGYSGAELIRLLSAHPHVSVEVLISHSTSGFAIKEVYPHLTNIVEHTLESMAVEKVAEQVDFLFFATPSGVSKDLLPVFVEKDVLCIDLSGDFRLHNAESYAEWYNQERTDSKLLSKSVYGLTEFNREQVQQARWLANPGCYPTATLLGILPAIKMNQIEPKGLVIDGKSGVSGAGRKASLASHFGETNENLKIYKVGRHQHIPEIEQMIETITGEAIPVTFSTHLIPMTRGIMCTMYANLKAPLKTEEMVASYKEFYQNDSFVRVREPGVFPATKEVYGSNFCDIGLHVDERTGRVTIVSVIDNMVKGAAGQAIQNMNLMLGFEETTGLNFVPVYP